MGMWSSLVVDLLSMIDEHNEQLVDKIRLRCVCKHWQSLGPVSVDLRQPHLLLPYANKGSACGLYHPFQNKVLEIDLPEAGDKVFKGSGHGWVVTAHKDGSIAVLNPLSRAQFPLPPRYKFPDVIKYRPDKYVCKSNVIVGSLHVRNYLTNKIALSSSPYSSDFRAVALYGEFGKLAYCKIGDNKWRSMVEIDTNRNEFEYEDVTFYKGKLYAVQAQGVLMVCDDVVSCPKLRKCAPLPKSVAVTTDLSLVSAHDCLIAISRCIEGRMVQVPPRDEDGLDRSFTFKTSQLRVYKLDMSSLTWLHFKSLGPRALFLGLAAQWCIRSPGNDDVTNQIYFSSHQLSFEVQNIPDCFDNGIYHLGNKTFKPLGYECNPKIIWPSPIWVMLNPYPLVM